MTGLALLVLGIALWFMFSASITLTAKATEDKALTKLDKVVRDNKKEQHKIGQDLSEFIAENDGKIYTHKDIEYMSKTGKLPKWARETPKED